MCSDIIHFQLKCHLFSKYHESSTKFSHDEILIVFIWAQEWISEKFDKELSDVNTRYLIGHITFIPNKEPSDNRIYGLRILLVAGNETTSLLHPL